MSMLITIPGTDTKETPEMEAPTMPNATIYHGDCRLPRKKVSLEERRAVSLLSISRAQKYNRMVTSINIGHHLLMSDNISQACATVFTPFMRRYRLLFFSLSALSFTWLAT